MKLTTGWARSHETVYLIIRKWANGLNRRTLPLLAIIVLASGCSPQIINLASNLPEDQLVVIHGTDKYYPVFITMWVGKHIHVEAVDGRRLYPDFLAHTINDNPVGLGPGKYNLSYNISFGLCGAGLLLSRLSCFRHCRDGLVVEVEAGKHYVIDADTTPTPIEVVFKEKETDKVVAKGECKCTYTGKPC